ncbi:MAG: hypothetical protein LBH74_08205 [Nitrososphaerota archaeon]|jgi:hypothetical protein|nr:hypothetical protein [Nitrososphaerota archaeon]
MNTIGRMLKVESSTVLTTDQSIYMKKHFAVRFVTSITTISGSLAKPKSVGKDALTIGNQTRSYHQAWLSNHIDRRQK